MLIGPAPKTGTAARDRLKTREEDRKYSKSQMAARQRAAADLEKQAKGPWWSKVGAAFGLNNLTAMANRCNRCAWVCQQMSHTVHIVACLECRGVPSNAQRCAHQCREPASWAHSLKCNVCVCSYVRSDPGEARVGSRKRARPVVVAEPGQLSDGRGTIPLERSLVLSVDTSLDDL